MRISKLALIVALTVALGAGSTAAAATAPTAPTAARQAAGTPALIAVRAASHSGFDRVVWEFRGGLPAHLDPLEGWIATVPP